MDQFIILLRILPFAFDNISAIYFTPFTVKYLMTMQFLVLKFPVFVSLDCPLWICNPYKDATFAHAYPMATQCIMQHQREPCVRTTPSRHVVLSPSFGLVFLHTFLGVHHYTRPNSLRDWPTQSLVRVWCPHTQQLLPSCNSLASPVSITPLNTPSFLSCQSLYFRNIHFPYIN